MYRRFLFVLLVLGSNAAIAQTVPPEQIGLSAKGLQEITKYLQNECDENRVAGAVAAVSRHGRLGYMQAVGRSDLKSGARMRSDSLFRIASMTKAITSASVMSLVEDCLLYTSPSPRDATLSRMPSSA